jgi:hypothetical protein
MKSKTEFSFSNKGVCQYEIGQKCPEFAPMNYEVKYSFNEKSLDIIIGLAPSRRNYFNDSWLSISLFVYRCIPTILITTGYLRVTGSIIIKNRNNIDVKDWVNGSDDYVNLILVDDYDSYEIKEIRRVRLPMMNTIRNVLKKQIECVDGEIKNTLEIIERGFQIPWMIEYKDEECKFVKECSDELQTGEYIIYEPKEKVAHVY